MNDPEKFTWPMAFVLVSLVFVVAVFVFGMNYLVVMK